MQLMVELIIEVEFKHSTQKLPSTYTICKLNTYLTLTITVSLHVTPHASVVYGFHSFSCVSSPKMGGSGVGGALVQSHPCCCCCDASWKKGGGGCITLHSWCATDRHIRR